MSVLSKNPGFCTSGNAKLSALRINGEERFLVLVGRAIRLNHGHVGNAATALDVHRNTLMRWINHYSVLQEARDEARIEAAGIEEP